LLAASTLLSVTLALWAFWWEPRRVVVREIAMTLPCWRGAPIRVAVVSDLHVGSPYMGLDKLEEIVRTINAAHPDAVVLLGDYVIQGVVGGEFVTPEEIAKVLGKLRAPLGVHAVLGNHDWWLDASRVGRAFESANIQLLEDAAVRIERTNGVFWLVGISDYMEGAHDVTRAMAQVTDAQPVIAITHNPDVFPSVPDRVCLTLAGHTHGGQVAIPGIGRPIVPSRYGERYAIGHIHEHGKQLFVTAGVGTSILPVRFRVPPELVMLEIRAPGA
jgi:predicted MPP superfamily phosphohydrolase